MNQARKAINGTPITTADVIVVGGGVLGTFHAYFAAQKGYKVLLLEQNEKPNNASVQNFGMVATATIAASGDWEAYADTTNQLYRQLDEEMAADSTLRRQGTLYLVHEPLEVQLLKEFAEVWQQKGKRAEFIPREAALKAYDFARPEYVNGAMLLPDDMAANPRLFIHRIQEHFQRLNLFDYQTNTFITRLHKENTTYTLLDAYGRVYQSEHVIICNGAQYQALFPQLFQMHELQICKLYMYQTRPQAQTCIPHNILSGLSLRRYPGFEVCPSFEAFSQTPFDAIYKDYGIHLLFKQADDGSVIIGDSHEYFDANTNVTFDIEDHITDAVLDYGKRMVHLDTWKLRQTWYGCYSTYKGGEVFTYALDEHLHIATGIAGKGISTGPGFCKANVERILF